MLEYSIQQSIAEAVPEPYNGIEFESLDEAQKCYNSYERVKAFGTLFLDQELKSNNFSGICLFKRCEGNKHFKREDRIHIALDETREGSKAMLLISKKEQGKWEFNNCIHNTLTPNEFEDAWMRVIQTYNLQEYVADKVGVNDGSKVYKVHEINKEK
ncbi:protein FAR-RED ELONGATED HYPOCOTYL 3-like [Gossypium australe]|uniref:Protein FAR-RED ELONGATED HYPOCOTYL 3-like n=1 Tax=Gossypium australe TaxID=47621 RepID=A0A5B6USK8_9ROSI|nr:protein FAR-RED ELONGATED HYPOCOTYL 3-like [Gossypium australe]